jgi:hypothetical protein
MAASPNTHLVSDGGIAATHPATPDLTARVAPATGDELNRIRAAIIPVACWRLEDIRFEFDSSFVVPDTELELEHLAQLVRDHPPSSKLDGVPGFPLSVFGHADPVGNDDYNKQLSGRRAIAIYAMLIRDPDRWERLFSQPLGRDRWGRRSLERMLDKVSPPPPGQTNEQAAAQHEASAGRRRNLYLRYMDALCGPELRLERQDFLGHGDDAGGKGDFQGCSEFNPLLIFSQKEEADFAQEEDKTRRNAANSVNRRVVVLIFRKGTRVTPSRWPCPRATEGVADCRKRFFTDAETRRGTRLPDKKRLFSDKQDTFACRFYQRLVQNSPCERVKRREIFRYGVEIGVDFPWTDDSKFRILAEDGKQDRRFAKSEGVQAGTHRVFNFVEIRPGVRYKGSMIDQRQEIELFGFVELARVMDVQDPQDVLPLPELPPFRTGPDPADPAPSVLFGPVTDIDPDVDDDALDPPVDPQLKVPF